MTSYLTPEQIAQLLRPLNPKRVNRDGKGHSHLQQHDVRAHLIRVFGFARWSAETPIMELVFETSTEGDKPRWTVCYRAQAVLTICAPDGTVLCHFSDWATGEAINQPSRGDAHDLSVKTAASQALKRCAINLGTQFALGLYNGGELKDIVGRSLVSAEAEAADAAAVDTDVPEIVPESETVEAAPDTHTQSQPPKEISDEDTKADRVSEIRDALLTAKTRSAVSAIAITVSKEGLRNAMTDDGEGNVCSVGALLDDRLKRVMKAS